MKTLRPGEQGCRVPLSIGTPVEDFDKKGEPCISYDVVANPEAPLKKVLKRSLKVLKVLKRSLKGVGRWPGGGAMLRGACLQGAGRAAVSCGGGSKVQH